RSVIDPRRPTRDSLAPRPAPRPSRCRRALCQRLCGSIPKPSIEPSRPGRPAPGFPSLPGRAATAPPPPGAGAHARRSVPRPAPGWPSRGPPDSGPGAPPGAAAPPGNPAGSGAPAGAADLLRCRPRSQSLGLRPQFLLQLRQHVVPQFLGQRLAQPVDGGGLLRVTEIGVLADGEALEGEAIQAFLTGEERLVRLLAEDA